MLCSLISEEIKLSIYALSCTRKVMKLAASVFAIFKFIREINISQDRQIRVNFIFRFIDLSFMFLVVCEIH